MSNIQTYLAKIKAAIYGEEVRGAIHDSIKEINKIATEASKKVTECGTTVEEIKGNAVVCTAQELSEEEKQQTRINIGAIGQTELDKVESELKKEITENSNRSSSEITDLQQSKADAIICEAEGTTIVAIDSSDAGFEGLSLYGKSEQFTTTGAQLFDVNDRKNFSSIFSIDKDGWISFTCDNSKGTGTLYQTWFTNKSNNFVENTEYLAVLEVSSISGGQILAVTHQEDDNKGQFSADYTVSSVGTHTKVIKTREAFDDCPHVCRSLIQVGAGSIMTGKFRFSIIANTAVTPSTFVYEPYTGGMPSPNPEYPQEVVSVGNGGSVVGKVCGKNLINNEWYQGGIETENGVKITPNDYWIHTKEYLKVDSDKTYALSTDMPCCICVFRYDKNKTYLGFIQPLIHVTSIVHIFDENCKYVRFAYNYSAANEPITPFEMGVKHWAQLEYGDTATPYEPYKETTITLQTPNGLPGIKVTDDSLATYTDENGQMWCADEIDVERGVYVKRIGKAEVTGDYYSKNSGNFWRASSNEDTIYLGVNFLSEYLPIASSPSISDKLIRTDDDSLWNNTTIVGMCIGTNTTISTPLRIRIPNDNGYITNEKIIEWLTINPITVYYILATPIETPLSDEEILAYKALHTNKPTTTIMNSENVYMKCSYIADTKNHIKQNYIPLSKYTALEERVAAIEELVIS